MTPDPQHSGKQVEINAGQKTNQQMGKGILLKTLSGHCLTEENEILSLARKSQSR